MSGAYIRFQDNDLPDPAADGSTEGGGADDIPNQFGRAWTWTWGLGGVFWSVTQLVAKTLAQSKSYLARWSMSSISELSLAGENAQVPVPASDNSPSNGVAEVTSCDATARSADSDPEEEEKPTIVAGGVDDPFRRFPRFDVAKSPSDHHYLETTDAQVIHSLQKQIIIPKVLYLIRSFRGKLIL
jgi:hypothetical protein